MSLYVFLLKILFIKNIILILIYGNTLWLLFNNFYSIIKFRRIQM